MASPRIEYAVLPAGDGPGQDRCFTADGLVVVLDGASAIDPVANPDATEYVDTLGPLLIEQITGTPGVDLRAALAEAIRKTAEKLALVPGTAPSSTVSILRWDRRIIDALVLGDSPVVAQLADGSRETVVQNPQGHIGRGLRRRYRERLLAGHGYDEEHRSILAEIQRCEAAVRNHPDGYYIAESYPGAAWFGESLRWSTAAVAAVAVASDGAGGVLDEEHDFLSLNAGSRSRSIFDILQDRHRWEEYVDPTGLLEPRSKKHDDKALCLVTFDDQQNGPHPPSP